jgi:hypothetical protein
LSDIWRQFFRGIFGKSVPTAGFASRRKTMPLFFLLPFILAAGMTEVILFETRKSLAI